MEIGNNQQRTILSLTYNEQRPQNALAYTGLPNIEHNTPQALTSEQRPRKALTSEQRPQNASNILVYQLLSVIHHKL